MGKELTIAYLIPQFPGQTHIFFWRELQEMEARGAKLSVFSTRMPPKGLISHSWSGAAIARTEYLVKPDPLGLLAGALSLPWGQFRDDIRREGKGLLKEILICAGAARQLVKSCKAQEITHIHAHSCARAALIAMLASRLSGIPYSLTLHGPMSDYGIGQRLKWRHAAFATIITEKLRAEVTAELGQDLPDRIFIQPMGVDVAQFDRATPYVSPTKDGPVKVFACGRLNLVKGHQDLLQAAKILKDKGIDIQLEIAGEDDDGGDGYRKVLEARLDELGLRDNARLLGAIDGDAVKQRLLEAHVFVLASWHEPLGVAYMEAMSCGVPTIGTDAGGVRELIIDGESGLLVAPQNPDALANAISRIAADPDYAMGLSRGGRDRVVGHFRSSLGAETLLREIS